MNNEHFAAHEPVPISTEEFDAKFDRGEEIIMHLDLKNARRPGRGDRSFQEDHMASAEQEMAGLQVREEPPDRQP